MNTKPIQLARGSRSALCMAIVCAAPACLLAADQTNRSVLDTLRAKDQQAAAGLSMSLEFRIPANPFDPAQGVEIRTCSLTSTAQTAAISSRSAYSHPPVFRAEGVRDYSAIDFDQDGSLVVWRTSERFGLFAPDRNDALEQLEKHIVGPGGVPRAQPQTHTQLQKYPIGIKDNLYEREQIMLCAGRGMSANLERLLPPEAPKDGKAVEPLPPGLELVRAVGSYGPGLHGAWVLLVEPKADYLVRYARFTADGENHPTLTIQTSGVVRADSLTFAKQGTFTYIYDVRGSYEVSVTINSVSAQPDAQLIETVRGRVSATTLPEGSETIDFRKPEPERTFQSP